MNCISGDDHSRRMIHSMARYSDNKLFNIIELIPESMPFHCNNCQCEKMSEIKLVPGLLTYLSAGIICLFG